VWTAATAPGTDRPGNTLQTGVGPFRSVDRVFKCGGCAIAGQRRPGAIALILPATPLRYSKPGTGRAPGSLSTREMSA